MDDLTVSAAMAGLTNVLWAPDGWPHLLLWALMDGPTEVSPIRLNILSRLWASNGWTHLILWAPMAGPTEVPFPINPSSRLRRPTSSASVMSAAPSFLSVLVGGGVGV